MCTLDELITCIALDRHIADEGEVGPNGEPVNVFIAVEDFLARIGKGAHTNTVKAQIRAVLTQNANAGALAPWQQELIGGGDRSRGNSRHDDYSR